jgi:GNAT superfamily N-acetyltransferase
VIRRANGRDAQAVMHMALEFHAESSYAQFFAPDVEQLAALITYVLEFGAVFLLEKQGQPIGMLAAHVIANPVSGELTGSEVAFWIDPAHRGGSGAVRLQDEAEAWAASKGAVAFQMVEPAGNPGVARLYARRGYRPLETTHHKPLN